jgi:PAS domain S-box-containing protein
MSATAKPKPGPAAFAGHDELEVFRRVFFSSPDYIAFSRLSDGTYIDVNPGFETMLGYKRDEVIGRTSFDVGIWPENESEQRTAYVAELKRAGKVKDYPGKLRKANGDIIDVEASANIIDINGDLILIAIIRDVTERRKAENELREREAALRALSETLEHRVRERTAQLQKSEARMRSIFETSYQFMGFMAPDGTLLDANRTSLDGIRCELADVVGKPLWDTPWFTATPGMPEKVRQGVQRVAAGETVRREIGVELPDGWRIFDFAMRPVRDEAGKVVAIIPEAVELTDRRRAEDALRQAQKMEAVGQLTGGLAHDFNNMLAGVVGNLQLMRVRLAQGNLGPLPQYIDAAESIMDRAAALTHRLLAFSRRQTLAAKVIDVNELVESMTELIKRTVGPAVQLDSQLASDAWNTRCDAHQLESALLNLAINARDAMPSGGRLTLATQNAVVEGAATASADAPPAGSYVTIIVRDNGCGMTPDVLARAFDPFFTTKPAGHGTGLGLSMVFGFIKQSGGYVRIQSEVGTGTTVTLYLPMHASAADRAQPENGPRASAPAAAHAGASATILLVDDDAPLRRVLAEALAEAGYASLQAADGNEALALLQSASRIDLLISDIGLPGEISGWQIAEAARTLRPGLKLMLVTGYADLSAAQGNVLSEGTTIMSKPFSLNAFAEKVSELLTA